MKRVAVCVGLDKYAPGTGTLWLSGCVNDALAYGQLLRMAGYSAVVLADRNANRRAIYDRISRISQRLRPGDAFALCWAGHGWQVADMGDDEVEDHLDEALVVYDENPRQPFTDDSVGHLLGLFQEGVRIEVVIDSCHSGTITRGGDEARRPRLWVPPEDVRFQAGEANLNVNELVAELAGEGAVAYQHAPVPDFAAPLSRIGHSGGAHVLMAACAPGELSDELRQPNGRVHGAFTAAFARAVLRAWRVEGRAITWAEAAALIGAVGPEQHPQLEAIGGAPLDAPVFGFEP